MTGDDLWVLFLIVTIIIENIESSCNDDERERKIQISYHTMTLFVKPFS